MFPTNLNSQTLQKTASTVFYHFWNLTGRKTLSVQRLEGGVYVDVKLSVPYVITESMTQDGRSAYIYIQQENYVPLGTIRFFLPEYEAYYIVDDDTNTKDQKTLIHGLFRLRIKQLSFRPVSAALNRIVWNGEQMGWCCTKTPATASFFGAFHNLSKFSNFQNSDYGVSDGKVWGCDLISNGTATGQNCGIGLFAGGQIGQHSISAISYVYISVPMSSDDFGNLTGGVIPRLASVGTDALILSQGHQNRYFCAASNNTRAVFKRNYPYSGVTIDSIGSFEYVNFDTPGNAIRQCFSIFNTTGSQAAASNSTNNRMVVIGGFKQVSVSVEYLNMTTGADTKLFGNLITRTEGMFATSNGTNNRVITGTSLTSEYFDITSPANSTVYGNLLTGVATTQAGSDGVENRALIGRLYSNAYTVMTIDMTTQCNATNFGDISVLYASGKGGASDTFA